MRADNHLPAEEMFRESSRATLQLAMMDIHEDLARQAEQAVDAERRDLAEDYRQAIGVAPERRHELRRMLTAIRDGTSGRVAAALRWLR